jgi:hypothetical protein
MHLSGRTRAKPCPMPEAHANLVGRDVIREVGATDLGIANGDAG